MGLFQFPWIAASMSSVNRGKPADHNQNVTIESEQMRSHNRIFPIWPWLSLFPVGGLYEGVGQMLITTFYS
jgi:hypothetical protein